MRTFGVEEEFLLVDLDSGEVVPVASSALTVPATEPDWQAGGAGSRITGELQLEQLEVSTAPCNSLAALAEQLRAGRVAADFAAQSRGARIAALATSPLPASPHLRPNPRYRTMTEMHGIVASEQLTCGMHIHVEVASDEEGVAVLDRIRVWLPFLLALSANSPYWQGNDTAFASFRSRVWNRWPTAGPTPVFGSAEAYHGLVEELLSTGVLLDPGMVYFDARLSSQYPTVEIRVPDVCLHVETAELVAGLARSLVETSIRHWRRGVPTPPVPEALLRVAMWKAARSGLSSELLDPLTMQPVPVSRLGADFLEHITGSFAARGEEARLRHLLQVHFDRGSGADWQRLEHSRRGNTADVVRAAVWATQDQATDAGETRLAPRP